MPLASEKQAVTAQIIKMSVKKGVPLSRDLLLDVQVTA
jgi:hypothetical protein